MVFEDIDSIQGFQDWFGAFSRMFRHVFFPFSIYYISAKKFCQIAIILKDCPHSGEYVPIIRGIKGGNMF